ncbi:hypothetical protein [Agrobacterium tumefaciens]|uniref:hypothetical protein n=1 Tax=Agrobacterium tumefaciens TaxID=358 RepID=UPI001178B12C
MIGVKASVVDIIKRVFPDGTDGNSSSSATWDTPPIWPPDVFAVAAFLLERSGLYAYLSPGTQQHWGHPWFVITAFQTKQWHKAAKEWASTPSVPTIVETLWRELISHGAEVVFARMPQVGEEIPKWVISAVGLMIIADEACGDVGYLHPEGKFEKSSWIALLQLKAEVTNIKNAASDARKGAVSGDHKTIKRHKYSITLKASTDLVAVQPKSHTAQIGATIRSMTQNLALLPPPSRMGATWQRVTGKLGTDDNLNILLVPLPYEFEEEWAVSLPSGDASGHWNWFDIDQRWLPRNPSVLSRFVSALITEAEKRGEKVHVVIFPELALTWDHYKDVVEYLAKEHPELEFVVGGSSTNCETALGNFALTSSISRLDGNPVIHTNSRGKHHRWRLDERQIDAYGLQKKLSPAVSKNWWEGIAIQRRQVHTHVFRNSSSFTTFICEDLARSDPAHETVRSLGPSIVFCLLMDGVQIPTRWSARYAEGLVEDPGSAVLTFTSRGLIQRSRDRELAKREARDEKSRASGQKYPRPENWSVALWRDKNNPPTELHCPPGDHALLLNLRSEELQERTYDGRANTEGVSWYYHNCETVRLLSDNPALIEFEASEKLPPDE